MKAGRELLGIARASHKAVYKAQALERRASRFRKEAEHARKAVQALERTRGRIKEAQSMSEEFAVSSERQVESALRDGLRGQQEARKALPIVDAQIRQAEQDLKHLSKKSPDRARTEAFLNGMKAFKELAGVVDRSYETGMRALQEAHAAQEGLLVGEVAKGEKRLQKISARARSLKAREQVFNARAEFAERVAKVWKKPRGQGTTRRGG